MPIARAVLATAEREPGRLALAGDQGRVTYGELVDSSRRSVAVVDEAHRAGDVSPAPEARGVPITAVSLTNAFESARLVASLALHRAVSAVIDPRWPLAHQVRLIVRAGIGVVVSDAPELETQLRAQGWRGVVLDLASFRAREAQVEPPPVPALRPDDEPFLLLTSSGTTGDPKAFLKTRAQYRANVAVSSAHLDAHAGVRTIAPGPLSYSLTLYAVIESLATAGSVVFADDPDPIAIGRRVQRDGVTRVVAVPAIVQSIADAARRDPTRFETLDLIVTGGANLPVAIRAAVAAVLPRAHLISYYGAAEIGFIGDSRGGDGTRISVYPEVRVRLTDAEDRPVPDGEVGTLWVLAAACSDGYLAATTGLTLRDPDGWATVGDVGRMRDGTLELVGRAGDIAVTGGHKVALTEVERVFDAWGSVVAVALPDATLGSVVALVLEGEAPAKSVLLAHARASLAPQFVPRRWFTVPALPRTVGGKIRRDATRELVERGEGRRL